MMEQAEVTVEALSAALVRLELPETKEIFSFLGDTAAPPQIDRERHEVADKLASVSREKQENLKGVVLALNKELGGLDRTLVNCLTFIDRAAERWENASPLDPFVKKTLLRRKYIFAALLLDQPEFVINEEHPVARLLALVEKLFMGWEEGGGQPPPFVMKSLSALTHLLDDDNCLSSDEQRRAYDALMAEWQRESQRRHQLEKRLIETELGLDNAWYIHQKAAMAVNQSAEGVELPEVVVQFMKGPWLDSMRLVLLQEGESSKHYSIMRKLCDRIVFTFRGDHTAASQQKLYTFAGLIVEELEKHLVSLSHNPNDAEQTLAWLEDILMSIVKGQDVERVMFTPAPTELDEVRDQLQIDELALTELRGGWFNRFDKVCKFLVYLPGQKVVVWGDYNGRKTSMEPIEDLIKDKNEGRLQAFDGSTRIQQVFYELAREYIVWDRAQRLRQQSLLAKEKALRKAAQEKAEAEAKAIIAAREEAARKLEQERLEAEQELLRRELEEQERKALERRQQARNAIDGLKVGGWVQLQKGGEPVRCKLGVRLNATDKLIFVDDFGMKITEMKRDEVVDHILDGLFEVLGAGVEMEERLSRALGRIGIAKR
ncbi:DUF1631 family protein [Hahella sp. HN01]|uniref:DUF1631 family protein n=1 Tax=unclassified Hahella TaxID=2624107 RepID=UPI0020A6A2E5|nr:DUF1631 family protein [Hahella sp. HN01]